MIWRVVLSDKIPDSLYTVHTHWTVADLVDAHEVLDIAEALEKEAHDRAKAEQTKAHNK